MKLRIRTQFTLFIALAMESLSLAAAQAASPVIDGAVWIDPQNPHYFNYQGKPIVLVTSDHTWFAVSAADYDYVKFLDALAENGNIFTRIYPGAHPANYENQPLIFPWARVADEKYELDKWNPAYFERLHAFMRHAQDKGVIVDICLFNGWGTDQKKTYQWRWDWCPLNDANNVQPGVGMKRDTQCTLEEPTLVAYQKAYVRKLVTELNGYDNLIYDVANEPNDPAYDWSAIDNVLKNCPFLTRGDGKVAFRIDDRWDNENPPLWFREPPYNGSYLATGKDGMGRPVKYWGTSYHRLVWT